MNTIKEIRLAFAAILLFFAQNALSIPAFPGAEGYGAQTIGGRGGSVVKVTNLNDSGPGSFREAVTSPPRHWVNPDLYVYETEEEFIQRLEESGRRIVVFEVSGIINLESGLNINTPYLTIAGETSPGGILVTGYQTTITNHDVIMRHMRFRVGSHRIADGADPETLDSFDILGRYWGGINADNIIIDHCSFSWGVDETVTFSGGVTNTTIQWSIVSEGLSHAGHPKGEHSKGLLVSGKYQYPNSVSVHHNYIAHNTDRSPMIASPANVDTRADVVNNVIYNWYGGLSPATSGAAKVNWDNNYAKQGIESNYYSFEVMLIDINVDPNPQIYVFGNIGSTRLSQSEPQWNVGYEWRNELLDEAWRRYERWDAPSINTTEMSLPVANDILSRVGATAPMRDSVDARVIADFSAGTGVIIDDVVFPDDFPVFQDLPVPADGDNDGMADDWEQLRGLDTLVDDSAGDDDGNGYTNIEEYLHYLSDKSMGDVNNPPVLDFIEDIEVTEGEVVSFSPSASDTDGDPLTYQYSGWMASNSYTTQAGDAGVHTVTVTVNDGELSDSQDVTVTVNEPAGNTVPSVPQNLMAKAESRSEVSLSWDPSTDDVAVMGYRVFRDGVAVATSTVTSFLDTGLRAKTIYSYEVTAYDSEGNESDRSSPVMVKTLAKASNPGRGNKKKGASQVVTDPQ